MHHPPPPPAPPAPPPPPVSFEGESKGKSTPDRNALLSQIRQGAKLKKTTEVNDRSSPITNHSKASGSSLSAINKPAATQNGPEALGALFAQGMPKLRPTGNRFDGSTTSNLNRNNRLQKPNSQGDFPKSHSQPSSPSLQMRQVNLVEKAQKKSSNFNTTYHKASFTNEINSTLKSNKPLPPPLKLKPNFNIGTTESCQTNKELSKLPAMNSKPCPPPKQTGLTERISAKPIVNSPNNTLSGGSTETVQPSKLNGHHSKFSTGQEQQTKVPSSTLCVPRPPIRNNSAPDNLNQLLKSIAPPSVTPSGSLTLRGSQLPRQPSQCKPPNYRPPPPPPVRNAVPPSVPPLGLSSISPPPVSAPPPPPPSAPPPPPPSAPPIPRRSPVTVPHIQMKEIYPPPPPPLRTTSKQFDQHDAGHEFESRFNNKFHKYQEFPIPLYKNTSDKLYISEVEKREIKKQLDMIQQKSIPSNQLYTGNRMIGRAAEC